MFYIMFSSYRFLFVFFTGLNPLRKVIFRKNIFSSSLVRGAQITKLDFSEGTQVFLLIIITAHPAETCSIDLIEAG